MPKKSKVHRAGASRLKKITKDAKKIMKTKNVSWVSALKEAGKEYKE